MTRLRARRWLLLLLVIPAAAVALWANYDVDSSGVHERDAPYSTATAQLYVDQAQSALGDATVVPEALVNRATVYVQVASSRGIVARAASLAGVPVGSFSVVGLQPGEGPATSRPSGPAPAVFLSSGQGAALVIIAAQAPDGALAARLANAMSRSLREFVLNLQKQQRVPREDQIRLRQLGTAQVRSVVSKASVRKVVVTGFVLWFVAMALLMALDALIHQSRAERRLQAASAGPAVDAAAPEADEEHPEVAGVRSDSA